MKPVLDDNALGWARRGVWAVCIAVYLIVFVGGVLAGGDELLTVGRAIGTTLTAAVLGKLAVGLLERASLPEVEEKGPSDEQPGPVGSLVGLIASTNVAQQEDTASPA